MWLGAHSHACIKRSLTSGVQGFSLHQRGPLLNSFAKRCEQSLRVLSFVLLSTFQYVAWVSESLFVSKYITRSMLCNVRALARGMNRTTLLNDE